MIRQSIRGKTVNFQDLLRKCESDLCLGNTNVNVRGDILGKGGNIVTKVENIPVEYNKSTETVEKVSIQKLPDNFFVSPKEALETLKKKTKEE